MIQSDLFFSGGDIEEKDIIQKPKCMIYCITVPSVLKLTKPRLCKMDSELFVPTKLTFSEYSRCLNFLLQILWPAKTKQV